MSDERRMRGRLTPLTVFLVTLAVLVTAVAGVAVVAADPVLVGPGTVFEASDDGPTVEVTEELELDSPFEYPDEHTVDLSPYATFESAGDTNVTVDSIDGEWTALTTHDVAAGLTVDPHDKGAITVEGDDVDTVEFRDIDVGATDPELRYQAGENVIVTVTGLPAGETVEAINIVSGGVIATAITDTNGLATFDLPGNGGDVTFTVETGGPSPPPSGDPNGDETDPDDGGETDPDDGGETDPDDGGESGLDDGDESGPADSDEEPATDDADDETDPTDPDDGDEHGSIDDEDRSTEDGRDADDSGVPGFVVFVAVLTIVTALALIGYGIVR